jgi:small-conductance mechanosensitive channel
VYLVAIYVGVLSFKFNNKDITFSDFLDFKLIDLKSFQLDFYDILVIISVFYGARIIVNLVRLYLGRKFRNSENHDLATEYVYMQVAKYIIYTIAFFLILNALNVQPTLFLGGSAAILVGLGLGIQDVFKDMFSGLVLLFEGSIRVGDVIQLHDGKSKESIVAKILRVNVRTTQIETRDGNILIVPNAKLTQEYIENWTHGATSSRFRISVTVEYGSNVKLVEEILVQSAMAHPKVNKNEQILVRLYEFGENGLQLELIFWADQSWDINNYKSEIRFEIDRLFRHYGITIPFAQRVVHVSEK